MTPSLDPVTPEAKPFGALSAGGRTQSRQRVLDPQDVTRVALELVDHDGLGGLTMRRLAEALGVSLATLYSTSGGKDQILGDMIDVVLGKVPAVEPAAGHELEQLIELWTAAHELMVAHPSVAQLEALRPVGGIPMLRLAESTLMLLKATGVSDDDIPIAYHTIRAYVLGLTLLRVSRAAPAAHDEEQRLVALSQQFADSYTQVAAFAPKLAGPITSQRFAEGLSRLLEAFTGR
jgi:AcrR family transcriptional regulator